MSHSFSFLLSTSFVSPEKKQNQAVTLKGNSQLLANDRILLPLHVYKGKYTLSSFIPKVSLKTLLN